MGVNYSKEKFNKIAAARGQSYKKIYDVIMLLSALPYSKSYEICCQGILKGEVSLYC
jgi:hypothetical protein